MKKLLLACFTLSSISMIAQTTHFVTASGMSFTPNNLTIDLGDSVSFTNTSGTHNVNGTQATFASNPASFGNALGTGWTYGFKFTIEGTYSYKCDAHVGMTGTITVVDPNSIDEKSTISYTMFPNPTSNLLTIKIDQTTTVSNGEISVVLRDITGKEIMRTNTAQNHRFQLSLENLVSGIYFCSVLKNNELIATEKVVKL